MLGALYTSFAPAGARNIPPQPVEAMRKASYHEVRGLRRAADGLEGGNPERARECISTWKRFPPQPQKASYRGVEGLRRAADGLEGGNPERARECISTWKRFPPQPQKASYRGVEGLRRAADGNRTRVSGLGSVRSTIELQPHLFQCIAPACRE